MIYASSEGKAAAEARFENREKSHKQIRRGGLLSIAAAVLLIAVLGGCASEEREDAVGSEEEVAGAEEAVEATEAPVGEEAEEEETLLADSFIEAYNAVAETPITDVTEVDVTDKESGHYRTEFRLSTFDESVSRTGFIGEDVIDIVTYGEVGGEGDIRIYFTTADADTLREVIRTAAPILDESLSDEEIEKQLETAIEYTTSKVIGELTLSITRTSSGGYDAMLKRE